MNTDYPHRLDRLDGLGSASTARSMPATVNARVPSEFLESHPFRIDLADDSCLRFRDIRCAARSALAWRVPLWDEQRCAAISLAECLRIVG